MTDTPQKLYRELDEVPLEDLEQLMQLLQDVRVAPKDLLAYAMALDIAAEHKEMVEEEKGAMNTTLEDVLKMGHGAEADDGDLIDVLYSDARLCLVKMGKLEAR